MKRILALIAALFVALSIGAQTRTTLTIICNQVGAQVFINGRLYGTTTPNATIPLAPNTYQLAVVKTGFQSYNTTVTVPPSGLVLNVAIYPAGYIAPAPAPVPAPASKYPLTVTSPAPNTRVYINGALEGNAPLTIQLIPGTYNITTRTPNMMEWNQQVQIINGPVTVNPGSQPLSFNFQASANNIPGAVIILNGNQVGTGSYSAALPGGTYNIVIRAPGYNDYSETFNLNGPKSIMANLQAQAFPFQASANNAPGAAIFLNGNQVATGSYNAALPPGTYTVLIRAAGFNDYTETFNLTGPRNMSVSLQQALVSFTFSIPNNFLNPDAAYMMQQGRQNEGRGNSEGKGNDFGQGRPVPTFELYVDGNLLYPVGNNVWTGAVTPGNHVFKIISGGLRVESSVNLQPGRNWVVQPSLGISAQ
ncbi:MAG TPA: PEGA domain-containing protein [Rectinemataceae bacterium]|nr:PEGA domain-containing protein [Rectinemataceae bacterium]